MRFYRKGALIYLCDRPRTPSYPIVQRIPLRSALSRDPSDDVHMSVQELPVSHGTTTQGNYESSAFFIRVSQDVLAKPASDSRESTGAELLFFGDIESWQTGEDAKRLNTRVWQVAAEKWASGTLRAIFVSAARENVTWKKISSTLPSDRVFLCRVQTEASHVRPPLAPVPICRIGVDGFVPSSKRTSSSRRFAHLYSARQGAFDSGRTYQAENWQRIGRIGSETSAGRPIRLPRSRHASPDLEYLHRNALCHSLCLQPTHDEQYSCNSPRMKQKHECSPGLEPPVSQNGLSAA